ncbi:restriction endonuclease subunit S [Legionella longbeachae]|uniref:restriction endonuclease subunit S n=1 Tax=Legionella longbeachae TaxID=450 RepID=UPI001404A05C|nr:restriction endonuclease subunit S [Legionella longbeachae]QIN36797.1 hypothetical protein GCS73_14720 [Legionella longbeachae]
MIFNQLPKSWSVCLIGEAILVNPRLDKRGIDDDIEVSFVPMPAVSAETGEINVLENKLFAEVKKGYTPFIERDVLFAKITPCMENGKMAVVPKLKNNLGFGSTEFHVLRCPTDILPEYVYYFISSKWFRVEAEHNMTGAVGQRRVPTTFLESAKLPVPPFNEQKRIVAKIEELFSELDNGISALKTAREQLKVYRQAILKHAFEGKLTAKWREENLDKLQNQEQLLAHIQQERNTRYHQQLNEWKAKAKPGKPKKPEPITSLSMSEVQDLFKLPEGWVFLRLGNFIDNIDAGKSFKCDEREPFSGEIGVAKVSAVTWGEYDESESKTCLDAAKVNPDYFIKSGDFILSRANTIELVGACVIARRVTKPIMLSDKTLRINFSGINEKYVLQYLRSHYGRNEIMKRSTGNQESMRNIGQDRIHSIVIPVCGSSEMNLIDTAINEKLESISQLSKEIEIQLLKAETLRQSILKKAFSGKLVPQDPSDESASELLARIRAEKEHQTKPANKSAIKRTRKKINCEA